jgi:hypothetical protein
VQALQSFVMFRRVHRCVNDTRCDGIETYPLGGILDASPRVAAFRPPFVKLVSAAFTPATGCCASVVVIVST